MFLDEVAAVAVAEAAAKAAEPITDGRSTSSSHKGCRGQNSTTSMSVDAVVEDKPKGSNRVTPVPKAWQCGAGWRGSGPYVQGLFVSPATSGQRGPEGLAREFPI